MKTITIEISDAAYLGCRAYAVQCGIPTTDIFKQFAAALAGTQESGGSDERDMAESYVKRCNYAFALHWDPADKFPPMDLDAPENKKRSGKWWNAFFAADSTDRRRAAESWRMSRANQQRIRAQFDEEPHNPWEGTLAEWLDLQEDGYLPEEIDNILMRLAMDKQFKGGGGAAPAYTLTAL